MRGYCTTEFTYVIGKHSQQENTTSSCSEYAAVKHDINAQEMNHEGRLNEKNELEESQWKQVA